MQGGRGTPGYIAPELWGNSGAVTEKCDVYSYGMLLFKILSLGRIKDEEFPQQVWEKFQKGQLKDIFEECNIEGKNQEKAKRMALTALSCVQYLPSKRPSMNTVMRLLQSTDEFNRPSNPFQYLDSSREQQASSDVNRKPDPEYKLITIDTKMLGPWGGPGGGWDDEIHSGIKQILLHKGPIQIIAIQIEYYGKEGKSQWKQRHGYSDHASKTIEKIILKPSEFIVRMTGFYGHEFGDVGIINLQSLCFYTNKGVHGPYGKQRGTYFDTGTANNGKVVGMYGRSGAYLDAIGVHMEYSHV